MSSLQPHQLSLSVGLRDDATLENFYSHHNDLAVQAVERIAQGSDGAAGDAVAEPFVYLWGEPGAGCSHLLQAACHRAGLHQRSAFYLPLDQFMNQGPRLLDGLETLDLVCIDQLQKVAGLAEWDEALFHLFNRIRDAGHQLLVAADAAPRQLAVALPDLASRLSWGVVLRIHALDDDGKMAALRARAHDRGIELDEGVVQYIFYRSPRQTHELFALLDRLDRASLSAQRKVTIPFVKQLLGW